MSTDYDDLPERLSMTEIIRLQDTLSKALVRRFEKRVALVFSDVVGSTPYFARFGDEAGRKLQQRHVDGIQRAIEPVGGRIVDTAGDGAFLCFPGMDVAINAMVHLQEQIAIDNDSRGPDERLVIRVGCHFGPVLTDGVQVSGDAVNFCSRVTGSASSGEIRLTREAFAALTDVQLRLKCRRLKAQTLKGIDRPIELLSLDWHDPQLFPASLRFTGGGPEVPLPSHDVIRFGRLKEQDGLAANDVLLTVNDPNDSNRISRWHFELHRRANGFVLRSVSEALTEVDGKTMAKGEEAPVRPGTMVRVGGVLTIEFLADPMIRMGETTLVPR
jgi:class 3 adenylate cyclase